MAFYEGLPFELYDDDPENWNHTLLKLYSMRLILECSTSKKFQLYEIILHKFESNILKIRKYIQLRILLHLGLPKTLVDCTRTMEGNDYNSNQHVLIEFPRGSGGNFLRNCLHLSDDISCVGIDFCDSFLNINKTIFNEVKINEFEDSIKQIDLNNQIKFKKLNTTKKKLNYIISKTKSQVTWTDPILYLDINNTSKYNFHTNHFSINEIMNSELQIWPNCKTVIYFKNARLFEYMRKYPLWFLCRSYDNDHQKLTTKETFLQFIDRPQKHKKYVMNKLNDKTQVNSFSDLELKKTFHIWDTNWYFSEEETISYIKELYEILSLSGFDEDAISKYYNIWIKTMSNLKSKALNEFSE